MYSKPTPYLNAFGHAFIAALPVQSDNLLSTGEILKQVYLLHLPNPQTWQAAQSQILKSVALNPSNAFAQSPICSLSCYLCYQASLAIPLDRGTAKSRSQTQVE